MPPDENSPPPQFELTPELITLAIRRSATAWFECFGKIQTKGGQFLESPNLTANYLQRKMGDVYQWCMNNNVPCRMIVLKPRQKGCSTFSTAILYHFLSNYVKRGVIIGGDHSQARNLYHNIFKTYAATDTFLGGTGNKGDIKEDDGRFINGSTIVRKTANNPEAGRSATFEAVCATEVARWSLEGVANAGDVLAGLLKCMAHIPGTLGILESTAGGASGDFYDRWNSGIEFEDLKQGKDGWVRVFAPWFVFDDAVRAPALENIASDNDLSEHEKNLSFEHKLTLEQVAWMRWAIREECKGDFDVFSQDYPFDPITAFLTSGRRRFNLKTIGKMKFDSIARQPVFGNLEYQGAKVPGAVVDFLTSLGQVLWRPCAAPDSRIMLWEGPKEGLKYLISADVMTGASQVVGDDPDNHAIGVWRCGYFEPGVGWRKHKLVAQVISDWIEWEKNKKYILRWDIDVLTDIVWRLSCYYGKCLIVPESNMDRGMIELLKLKGANLYVEEVFNRTEQTKSKRYGFRTDKFTRETAVECLASGIREYGNPESNEGAEIYSPMLLGECESFVVKQSGKSEAMPGRHDDLVMMASIGLMTIQLGTVYRTPQVKRVDIDFDSGKRRVKTNKQYS